MWPENPLVFIMRTVPSLLSAKAWLGLVQAGRQGKPSITELHIAVTSGVYAAINPDLHPTSTSIQIVSILFLINPNMYHHHQCLDPGAFSYYAHGCTSHLRCIRIGVQSPKSINVYIIWQCFNTFSLSK